MRLVFRYIGKVRGLEDRGIIDVIAAEVGPEEAKQMQTLAEMWEHQGELKGRKEGHKEGRKEGRKEGERALLTRQLQKRFGELPPAVLARLEAADEATLERWGEALLDARALDDLFPPL